METITKRKLSIEDYHRMAEVGIIGPDDGVELIDGETQNMNGSPSGPIGKEHLDTDNQLGKYHLENPFSGEDQRTSSQLPIKGYCG